LSSDKDKGMNVFLQKNIRLQIDRTKVKIKSKDKLIMTSIENIEY